MADNSTSTQLVSASGLLDLTLPLPTAAPVAPAPAPVADPQKGASKQTQTVTTVRIGSEDLTPEQIAQRLAAKDSDIARLSPLAEVGNKLAQIGQQYGPQAAQAIVDYALSIERNGGTPPTDEPESWLVSPVQVPETATVPPPFAWADADPEIQFLYAHTEARAGALNDRLEDLFKIVKTLQSGQQTLMTGVQENQLVSDLNKLGVPATLDTIRQMRGKGIEPSIALKDPAMLNWMRAAHGVTPAAQSQVQTQVAPVAPANAGAGDVFDFDDPNATVQQKVEAIQKGMIPKDESQRPMFERLRAEFGQ